MDKIDDRIPGGCAVCAILNEKGAAIEGEQIVKMISIMHERSNGLGGGFAGYGIYPENKDDFCFHMMYDNQKAIENTEGYLRHD